MLSPGDGGDRPHCLHTRALNTSIDFPAPSDVLLSLLKEFVGPCGWRSGQEAPKYFEDPRHSFPGRGRMIVKLANTKQVSEIIKPCNQHPAGIIPYGGGTGVVVGQSSPHSDDAIILSLEK